MNKILIYAKNNNILIIGNAIDVDLISEYYSLIRDIPYLKKNFSYNVSNAENCICAMTIQKNRYHFANDTNGTTWHVCNIKKYRLLTFNLQWNA